VTDYCVYGAAHHRLEASANVQSAVSAAAAAAAAAAAIMLPSVAVHDASQAHCTANAAV
jgi:hypothetical protein